MFFYILNNYDVPLIHDTDISLNELRDLHLDAAIADTTPVAPVPPVVPKPLSPSLLSLMMLLPSLMTPRSMKRSVPPFGMMSFLDTTTHQPSLRPSPL